MLTKFLKFLKFTSMSSFLLMLFAFTFQSFPAQAKMENSIFLIPVEKNISEQAIEIGSTDQNVSTSGDLLEYLSVSRASMKLMEINFSENLAQFITHPLVVTILLSIGSLGLVMELFSRGFGVPGLMGVSAFVLFFYGHMVAGVASMESIIIFVIGMVLIVLELFVPGAILGIIGVGAIIASLLLSTNNIENMIFSILIVLLVTIIGSVILFKKFGYEKGIFRKVILFDSTSSEKGYVSNTTRPDLVGLEGVTHSPLRPSGTAIFNEERIDVVTEGGFIGVNKKVKIVKSEGARIVVREIND